MRNEGSVNIEANTGVLEIRELRTIAEMVAAERFQLTIWGMDTIPAPKEILIPAQHEGGLLAAAFSPAGQNNPGVDASGENDRGEMVGLIFGFPTRDPAIQHSHILGTLAEWRGQGVGARLKWFQRRWCLERGITRVRWTVDPLRAANAGLNIRHLGGTAHTYLPDYYGAMQGIDAGAPTDRLLVEWQLDSQRVAERAAQPPPDRGFPGAEPANSVMDGRPAGARYDLDCPSLLIHLPDDFVQLAKTDPPLALAWRLHTRELFQHYFARGYTICEFSRVDGPAYLLETR